jgi:adenylosuccinate lyase
MKTGAANDLVARMQADPDLAPFVDPAELDPRRYVGRAPEQVDEFLAEVVDPLLRTHAGRRGRFTAALTV